MNTRRALRLIAVSLSLFVATVASAESREDIRVDRDVPYGTHPKQRFDVYMQAQLKKDAPVIFMVHGGGWRRGDKRMDSVVTNKVAHWVPQGYVFISTNYRMLPEADPLEQAADIARAIASAQARAAKWGADPEKFILMGHSAGAHLIALVAADDQIVRRHNVQPWLGAISLDSGALDVVEVMNAPHMKLFDEAFGTDPKFWRATSPEHQLVNPKPPFLIVCSTRREQPCKEAVDFKRAGRSVGTEVEILPVDISHREINEKLGKDNAYTGTVANFIRRLVGLAFLAPNGSRE